MKKLSGTDVQHKNVLLRVDFNVDLGKDGRIIDPSRINAHLPTIAKLLKWGANKITLVSHLALPSGNFPLASVAHYLGSTNEGKTEGLSVDNFPLPFTYHFGVELQMLENVRLLFEGEITNDEDVSKRLASLADVFILDALSVAHREHASVCGVTKYIPSFPGPLLMEETEELSILLKNPNRPFLVIIGGAKVESKAPVIKNLLPIADKILVGGKVGFDIRQSGRYKNVRKVILPDPSETPGKDIGLQTIQNFKDEIQKARTILWAGPMGMVENSLFCVGTREIANAICSNRFANRIAAGGDTQKSLNMFGLSKEMDFISQGGGASLQFLAGEELPGLKALGYYS